MTPMLTAVCQLDVLYLHLRLLISYFIVSEYASYLQNLCLVSVMGTSKYFVKISTTNGCLLKPKATSFSKDGIAFSPRAVLFMQKKVRDHSASTNICFITRHHRISRLYLAFLEPLYSNLCVE